MSETWGIILAAGESKRMKSPKMLLPYRGRTFIENVIDSVKVSKVDGVMVVLGSHSDDILKVTGNLSVVHCYNENFVEGMLSSVKCGFSSLPDGAGTAVVLLGDQPMVSPEIINMLISAYHKSGKGIIIPVHNSERGHPILIDLKYREEVLDLDPEIGLKALSQKFPFDVLEVETDDRGVLTDIDTQEDYNNELNQIS
jgi:molybdenum cofactor cytidylyltransferase